MPKEARTRPLGETPVSLSARDAARLAYIASFGRGESVTTEPVPTEPVTTEPVTTEPRAVSKSAAALLRLGYAQIDTISVVERAHHHVLWNRVASYSPPVIDELQGEPRQAFEYWAHAAAYLPLEDYRYCLPRMRRIADAGHEWFPHDARMVDWALDRIKAEGPLRSQDFESEGARGPWWDWKPAKAALEYLFQSGRLMVKARPGFQKLYDLRERVLPPGIDTSCPSDEEMADWYIRRAASALGVFTTRDLAYNRKDGKTLLADALNRACEAGSLLPARIAAEGSMAPGQVAAASQGGACWVEPSAYKALASWARGAYEADGAPSLDTGTRAIRILSPFDNFIIDRKRSLRLLGLDYTLECYLPAAKRRFGYFSLPVFLYERPVGLVDCKADRKSGILIVRRCELGLGEAARAIRSPRAVPKEYRRAFLDELQAFAVFNACDAYAWQP